MKNLISLSFIIALLPLELGSSTRFVDKTSKSYIVNTIRARSAPQGIDAKLALAFAEVESTFNPNAKRGDKKSYSVGLFQIFYPTARDLGYRGSIDGLRDTDTNIDLGLKYLAKCQAKHGFDVRRIACCFNAGLYVRESVCQNDPSVVHYQNKIAAAYSKRHIFLANK